MLYIVLQSCILLQEHFCKAIDFFVSRHPFFFKVIFLFLKYINLYTYFLYITYIFFFVIKLIVYFCYLSNINNKFIVNFLIVIFLIFQSLIFCLLDFYLSLKEKLIKSSFTDVLKWRLRSLFISVCVVHWVIIYLGSSTFIFFSIFLFIKILIKFCTLFYKRFFHLYDSPMVYDGVFYWPRDMGFSYLDKIIALRVFFRFVKPVFKKITKEPNAVMLINNMLSNNMDHYGKYLENIYWYRSTYIYKNMYKVGLDMVTLMNFTFCLNKILFFCMFWRYMLRIVESKSKKDVNNIFRMLYNEKDNSFNHDSFRDDPFDGDEYCFFKSSDKVELQNSLDDWLLLLDSCKEILNFLKLNGKNNFELIYKVNLDYIQNYHNFCINERMELFIDVDYKQIRNLSEINSKFFEKVMQLVHNLNILDQKTRDSKSSWAWLLSFDVHMWGGLTHEQFIKLDLNTIKSDNFKLYKKELILFGLVNLKVKKNKEIVYF